MPGGQSRAKATLAVLGERRIEIGQVVGERGESRPARTPVRSLPASARAISSSALKVPIIVSASTSVSSSTARHSARPGLGQQRHLEPGAQPVERRPEIVGDVVGHLAHALQQPLDLVEHRVEVGGELVELVARAAERDPLAELARP